MIPIDISRYKCPNCQAAIAVDKIQDFNTRLCKRETFDCPSCNSKLNWGKTTHNLAHYSIWIAFLTFPLPFLGLYSFPVGIWVFFIFMILSGVGMLTKHLILDSEQKET